MYFGTVARYRIKPGHGDQFLEELKEFEKEPAPGWIYSTLFRSTAADDEYWISVVFDSEEAYRKNAASPEMGARYSAMLAHLDSDPEWHDGHVVHEAMRRS